LGCNLFKIHLISSDELGCLIAWKRHSEDRVDEFDLICKIQLEKSSITAVCASRNAKDGSIIRILVQIKSGSILSYAFDGIEFKYISEFACGTFTFCKISVLSADDETLLVSFPDEKVENGISVFSYSFGESVIEEEKKRILNGFIDGTSKNGMCLFSKLLHDPSCIESIFLLCGFENGRIILLKISCQCSDAYETVFDERIMEESCIDADLCAQSEELCIVAVGAGREIKIIRIPPQYPSSSHVIKSIDLPFPGCSGVSIRPDGRVFITAGWDCK
jgi:hypothetical protein